MSPQELAVTVEHRDAPDEIRVLDIRMTLGHVDVAIAGVGDDGVRIGQSVRRISPHARRPQCHQHLAFGTELDDDASLLVLARKLLELVGARHARVRHPHVSVAIDMDAVRPHEHSAAEAPDLLARRVEKMDRVGLGAETAGLDPRRATVGRPHGLAVPVDGDAVGSAPRPSLQRELRPIADDAIGIGAGIDRLNVLRLGMASGHHHPHDNRRRKPASRKSRHRHRSAPGSEKFTYVVHATPPATTALIRGNGVA